ncbi:MAG: hypothetical protein LBQ60_09695 [Bacteroidales bacterium]|jgi:ATP-dependent Zn protease|nr:hypothetical protein [Bacteroidales bacterium]
MIGAGHMLDMIHKVKQNLSMLPSKRSKFKEHGKKSFSIAPKNAPVYHKNISKEELDIILSEIQNKALKEKKKKLLISIVSGLFSLLLFLLVAYFFHRSLSSIQS